MKLDRLHALYHQPLFDLISQSREIHLEHWRGEEVQRCSLLSIKTGGSSEDCAYCAQSSHYSTGVEREELLSIGKIVVAAKRARAQGASAMARSVWRKIRSRNKCALDFSRATISDCSPPDERDLRLASTTDAVQFLE